jgi:hypothetical protein
LVLWRLESVLPRPSWGATMGNQPKSALDFILVLDREWPILHMEETA